MPRPVSAVASVVAGSGEARARRWWGRIVVDVSAVPTALRLLWGRPGWASGHLERVRYSRSSRLPTSGTLEPAKLL